jgi:TatA/E family protein of Tat protein translocase
VIVLIVFGASRLPQIGRGLRQAVAEFRRASRELDVEELLGETDEKEES